MLDDSHCGDKVTILELANGVTWGIAAADQVASAIVSKLREAMKLTPNCKTPDRRVLVCGTSCNPKERNDDRFLEPAHMDKEASIPAGSSKCLAPDPPPRFFEAKPGTVSCLVSAADGGDILAIQAMRVADIIARQSERNGALLLHGALAEWNGHGIILAGPSGAGKTTSSRRLPPSWQSLSDDTTLVVPDGKGIYWAHPWPTWSQMMFGQMGGTWNVQRSVPVKSIFYLVKDREEKVASAGTAQAACLLANSITRPILNTMMRRLTEPEIRQHYLTSFNNVCRLAQAVPCHLLHLTLKGTFWHEIESIVGGITSNASARSCLTEQRSMKVSGFEVMS